MKSPAACTVIAFPYTTAVNVKKRKIANKSASKHGCLKKIAKEIAKEDASEIARAATEKTDIAAAVKRSIKTLDDTINKEIARRAASQKLLEGTSDDAALFEPVKQPASSTERAPRKKKRLLLTREKLLTQRSTCSLCCSIFSTPWHMRRHIKNVHVGIKEKYTAVECSYCSKLFYNSGNRSKHIKRFHSWENGKWRKFKKSLFLSDRLNKAQSKKSKAVSIIWILQLSTGCQKKKDTERSQCLQSIVNLFWRIFRKIHMQFLEPFGKHSSRSTKYGGNSYSIQQKQ